MSLLRVHQIPSGDVRGARGAGPRACVCESWQRHSPPGFCLVMKLNALRLKGLVAGFRTARRGTGRGAF